MKRLLLASSCLFALTVGPLYAQNNAEESLPKKAGQAAPAEKNVPAKPEPNRTSDGTGEVKTKAPTQAQNPEHVDRARSEENGQEKPGITRQRTGEGEPANAAEGTGKRKQAAEPDATEPKKAEQGSKTEHQRQAGEKDPNADHPETRKEKGDAAKAGKAGSELDRTRTTAEPNRQPDVSAKQRNADETGKGNGAAPKATDSKAARTNSESGAEDQNRAGSGTKGGVAKAEGKVRIDEDRASSLHRDLVQRFGGRSEHLNIRVSVGVAIPETVRFRELPSTIVEEYPEFRGYSYFVEDDEVVIVEPRTREVVEVIGGGDGPRFASDEGGEVVRNHARFSRNEDAVIRRVVAADRAIVEVAGDNPVLRAPASAELRPLPESIASEMPDAEGYGYFVDREHRVIVVDRGTREVVDIVQ